MDVKVHGNTLIDWLANVIIKIVTTLFNSTIVKTVSGKIAAEIQEIIDKINNHDGAYERHFATMNFLNNIMGLH